MTKDHCHGSSCDGGHSHDDAEMGIQYSLYQKVDMENFECLNEEVDGSGKTVFKSFEERLDRSKFVISDSDEELLFNIPFTGNIKLKSIRISGDDGNSHPKLVKIYKNRPKMSFSDTEVQCNQEIQLAKDVSAEIEYPLKIPIFSGVYHLSLYFPQNYGEAKTKIYYIGLRGEYSEGHHHGVTICNYELAPNIQDHKQSAHQSQNFAIH